jgi:glycosyltransferase involved in cell wall biosynthesis
MAESAGDGEVTVIMAAHNEARFIGAAVASVQAQSFRPKELIVVDDGSTDETATIAAQSTGPVPVRILRNEHSKGPINTRNRGLNEATTEWIAVLDADDLWVPSKLERQMSFLERWPGSRPIAVLGTQGRHINEVGHDIGAFEPGGCQTEEQYEALSAAGGLPLLSHSSVIYRRQDALNVGGYFEDTAPAEDIDLFDRIASVRNGVQITIDESLIAYRKKRGGMMQSKFWVQQMILQRVVENRKRRHRGESPLTVAEFESQQRQRPLKVRAKDRLDNYGKWFYRFGAMNIVNGRKVVGAAQLAAAGLLRPRLVIHGIQQRFR